MAKVFIGKCSDCNYASRKVYAGPLLRDFKDRVPALDLENKEIITLIKGEQPDNQKIIPYTDERLKQKASASSTGTNSEDGNDNNYCPKCSSFALRFEFCGFAD